jgi:hypothetical protein
MVPRAIFGKPVVDAAHGAGGGSGEGVALGRGVQMRIRAGTRTVAATVIVLALGAAVATAAIPSRDGTISACYDLKKGDLRIVDAGGACSSKEGAIAWQQGTIDPPPPPVSGEVHFASVSFGGELVAGDAISSAMFGPASDRRYRVVFAEPVTMCAGTISIGTNGGGGTTTPHAVGTVSLFGDEATVKFVVPPSTDGTQTAFHLIVAC